MPSGITSQTALINEALAELGSTSRVTSINDGSNSAKRAKALWDDIVRELLSLHPWNFAIRRRVLNAAAEGPVFGYERRFQLPEDCLRWLPFAEGDPDFFIGEREGRYLLTDADAVNCRYIAMIDDVGQWPPTFAQAVMFRLAASMADGLTQSESKKDKLAEKAEKMLMRAKRIDGLETGRTKRGAVTVKSTWLSGARRPWPQVAR